MLYLAIALIVTALIAIVALLSAGAAHLKNIELQTRVDVHAAFIGEIGSSLLTQGALIKKLYGAQTPKGSASTLKGAGSGRTIN